MASLILDCFGFNVLMKIDYFNGQLRWIWGGYNFTSGGEGGTPTLPRTWVR